MNVLRWSLVVVWISTSIYGHDCPTCETGSVLNETQDAIIRHEEKRAIAGFEAGENIHGEMPDGTSYFLSAVGRNLPELLTYLIGQGVDLAETNNQGRSALHIASRNPSDLALKILLRTGQFDPNALDAEGKPALWDAVVSSPDAVAALLEAGANPNLSTHDRYQLTPLLRAADRGFAASLPLLIRAGASIKGAVGLQAMQAAARYETPGNVEAIAFLAQAGAPIHAMISQEDPLMQAIRRRHHEIIAALLRAGADPSRSFENGQTPIMLAITGSNDIHALKILLRNKPPVDGWAHTPVVGKMKSFYPDGIASISSTALMKASAHGQMEMVRMLLEAGADPALRNSLGETAADLARKSGHEEVVRLLEKSGDHVTH